MLNYKVGDRVKCISTYRCPAGYSCIKIGKIYTIRRISYSTPTRYPHVELQFHERGELSGTYTSDQFIPYKLTNKERIAKRMEELNEV